MIMAEPESERALSERIAGMLAVGWEDAPMFESMRTIDVDEAAYRARGHLDLALAVVGDVPDDGWKDIRLATAAMVVGNIGDAYAIASAGADARELSRSLPTIAEVEGAMRAGDVAAWCQLHGHPLDGSAASDGRSWDADPSPRGEQASDAIKRLGALGLAADVQALTLAQQPDWEGYASESKDAAQTLVAWLTAYRSLMANLEMSDDPDTLATFRRDSRPVIVKEIAHMRFHLHARQSKGAEAAAVVATFFTIIVLRCCYLLTTITDSSDAATLHLLTPKRLSALMTSLGTDAWVQSAGYVMPV
jgi:hypothetical protein